MAITIIDGFEVNKAVPIDTVRTIKMTLADRDAIPMSVRYEGLETRVIATKTKYVLEGGTANANWKPMVSSSIPDYAFSSIEEIRSLDLTSVGTAVDVWLYPARVYEWDAFSVLPDNGDTIVKPNGVAIGDAGRFVLRTELAVKEHTHQELQSQIDDKQANIDAVNTQVNQIETNLQQGLEGLKSSYETDDNTLRSEMAQVDAALQSSIDQVQSNVDSVSNQVSQSETGTQASLEELRNQDETIRQEAETKNAELWQQVLEYLNQIDLTLVQNINLVQQAFAAEDTAIRNEMSQADTELRGLIDGLNNALSSVGNSVGQVELTLQGLIEQKINDLQSYIQNENLKQDQYLEGQIQALSQSISAQLQLIQTNQNEISSLKEENDSRKGDLAREVERLLGEIDAARQSIVDSYNTLEQSYRQADTDTRRSLDDLAQTVYEKNHILNGQRVLVIDGENGLIYRDGVNDIMNCRFQNGEPLLMIGNTLTLDHTGLYYTKSINQINQEFTRVTTIADVIRYTQIYNEGPVANINKPTKLELLAGMSPELISLIDTYQIPFKFVAAPSAETYIVTSIVGVVSYIKLTKAL